MALYFRDAEMIQMGAAYRKVISISFLSMDIALMCSSLLCSMEKSKYPLYASITSMAANLVGNYLLIFGNLGCPKLGLVGAAVETLLARTLEALLLVVCILWK